MRVDVAAHAPHGRKYGTTFAESWRAPGGDTLLAVGAVVSGAGDRIRVADLLRTGSRAVVLSRGAFATALPALDRIVAAHAREARDDALAAALLLAGFPAAGDEIAIAGAGRLNAAVVDGAGGVHHVNSRAAALGTGIEPPDVVETLRLRRDDVLVVATVQLDPRWWQSGDRTTAAVLRLSAEPDAAAAVISSG